MSGTRGMGLLLSVMAAMLMSGAAAAATLDRMRQDNTIRIAYRADAPPFSYDKDGKPAGFTVDLCQSVARNLAQQLKLPSLDIRYVAVTAANRFQAIQQGDADLLCEPTSATLSRRALVDFSVTTFVDGASLLIGPDGPRNMQEVQGKSIGVLAGTTTEEALRRSLASTGVEANVVTASSHAEGLGMLDAGRVSAYFADRSILWVLQANSKAPEKLRLADVYLTIETYALAMPRGDDDFRLEVDRALSRIYGSGEIAQVLARTFGDTMQFGPVLQTMYMISGLPD